MNKVTQASPFHRRANLLKEMEDLSQKNVTCQHCPGTCCTFVGNTMQMTVLETLDLYLYLKKNSLWDENLKKRLHECIAEFRLHIRPSTGRGVYMRKSYTCPFFGHQSLGCPLPGEVKPYGCLGFNATQVQEESGKSCRSNLDNLKKREELFSAEEKLNDLLQEQLALPWSKESIPVALLELDQLLSKLSDPQSKTSFLEGLMQESLSSLNIKDSSYD